jgi:hypothetical protein
MDVLKSNATLKALKWILIKYGKTKLFKLKGSTKYLYFILEYRYAVLSRGMQLSELTKSKCSLVDLNVGAESSPDTN